MLRALRDQITYANVMATLAVFIALGGSSYAALKITGAQVRNHSLTGKDIKRNSLRGRQIKESSLSAVRRARNAARLGGFPAERFVDHCPVGTKPAAGTCFELAARPPVAYGTAVVECGSTDDKAHPGRRLPTHGELMVALQDAQMPLAPGGELTSNVWLDPPGEPLKVLYINGPAGSSDVTTDTFEGRKAFRCVTDPVE
jgi:hypothetical protein